MPPTAIYRDRYRAMAKSLGYEGHMAVGRGDAMTAAAPSGVVTFLFTDIEGSTRRWEADADAMRAALLAHDEVLRAAIEAHDGFLFSHTGDGVVAAFASPRSAVDAAIAAQRALELPVRMGMATGEAELRDGDYFGTVLNRAARVMAAGHGGQILVADSTASLLSGVDLVDLGPRRLRDVPTPVGVFQVRAPGLATDFPALRALDTSPGNLRPAATSFIGRESEVAEVKDGAASTSAGDVDRCGRGGQDPPGDWRSRHGWPMNFPTVSGFSNWRRSPIRRRCPTRWRRCWASPSSRARAWRECGRRAGGQGAAVGVRQLRARPRRRRRSDRSHPRALGDRGILATSREGLGVADEQLWPVPSLDVGGGIDSAAVNLFVERAQSVAPRFSMATPDEAGAVVEICRRLDGIPAGHRVGGLADGVDDRQRGA